MVPDPFGARTVIDGEAPRLVIVPVETPRDWACHVLVGGRRRRRRARAAAVGDRQRLDAADAVGADLDVVHPHRPRPGRP